MSKDNNVYTSKLIWQPSFKSLTNLLEDRRQLEFANDKYRSVVGSDSPDVMGVIHGIDGQIVSIVKRFVEYNDRGDQP